MRLDLKVVCKECGLALKVECNDYKSAYNDSDYKTASATLKIEPHNCLQGNVVINLGE